MFSFQGIMVFYYMPAAILFIILLFSILKLFFFFAIFKKGNNSIFQFQEKKLSYFPHQIFQFAKKSLPEKLKIFFFFAFSHYE